MSEKELLRKKRKLEEQLRIEDEEIKRKTEDFKKEFELKRQKKRKEAEKAFLKEQAIDLKNKHSDISVFRHQQLTTTLSKAVEESSMYTSNEEISIDIDDNTPIVIDDDDEDEGNSKNKKNEIEKLDSKT